MLGKLGRFKRHSLRLKWPPAYGPELVANGTFDTLTTGWTDSTLADGTIVSGRMRNTNNGAGTSFVYQAVATVVGQRYRILADALGGTAPATALWVGTAAGGNQLISSAGVGSKDLLFTATTTTTYINLANGSATALGQYNDFDNVSLKAVIP